MDNNLILKLKGGVDIAILKEERIGVQSDTPWLDRVGGREWNIDPTEVLAKYSTGNYFVYNAFFVVGEWGTTYGQTDGVRCTVPLANVVAIEYCKEA